MDACPTEVLLLIFANLPPTDIVKAREVSAALSDAHKSRLRRARKHLLRLHQGL